MQLATRLPSFEAARDSIAETLEIELTTKRVERLAERIGGRRVAEREADRAAWEAQPLLAKLAAPPGVKAPEVVCVSCDGGRIQRCDLSEQAKSHWCETKIGALMELQPHLPDGDPCPEVPDKFLELGRVDELTRGIKRTAPKGNVFQRAEGDENPPSGPLPPPREAIVLESPRISSRDVVASLADSTGFGKLLAASAWRLGFTQALLKAFVADGQASNWTIWEQHFKHLEFVPILDFIHALTYVYSAALAGRGPREGWPVYVRWITCVWSGQVSRVIAELAERSAELGSPPPDASEGDPRLLVSGTLTYLRNQQSRMNYPDYRKLGLPITSSPIESTVKQINYRLKGSEKFWSRNGAEALLQLRAEQLSDTAPLEAYWTRRIRQTSGVRTYAKAA